MKKISIITLMNVTMLFSLFTTIHPSDNPYTWLNPIKKIKHAYYMKKFGSQSAPAEDQEAIKKALAEMGTDHSIPLYITNERSNHNGCTVTKTGVWLDKKRGGDGDRFGYKKHNKIYRHYYAAAHVNNGTATQYRESDIIESNRKNLACGMIPGASMLASGWALLGYSIKKGCSGIKLVPQYTLLLVGTFACHPIIAMINGALLRDSTMEKRSNIENNAQKLAIKTIKTNHADEKPFYQATILPPQFRNIY